MRTQDKNLYAVISQECMVDLEAWLQERKYNASRYGDALKDRNGKPLIGLNFGGDRAGLIVCRNAKVLEEVMAVVLKHQLSERGAA